jgi:serine/threonine protein kinase
MFADFVAVHLVMRQVVRLLGVCTQATPIMLIMEYMANGSLVNVLRDYCPSQDGVLELLPFEMSRMGLDIACGMCFLSEKGFAHRDLAARFERLTVR